MDDMFLHNSTDAVELQELKQAALQNKLLERLIKTSAALLSGRTREEVLQTILRGLQESGFDRVRLFLLSPDGHTLAGVAQVGMEDERFTGISWSAADDYHFREILHDPRPRIFTHDPAHPDPLIDRFDKQDVVEWALFPLILRERVIGQLVADNKFSRRPIHEAELAPLDLFSMQAAAAIEKADLSARDEKKLRLFARLAQATTEIVGQIGKRSLHELLTLVAQYAAEILEAEVCSVLLCKGVDRLSLEAEYGYREGGFQRGMEFLIRSAEKGGFTGHIAYEGKPVNLHGETLRAHPAVHSMENKFTPSGLCYSVLASPLKQLAGRGEKLLGLLRAHNKKDENGQASPDLAFTPEDEWILHIFAEVIVVCLESVKLVEHKKLLIENLPHAVIAVDNRGNVTEFNQEAERILGYSAADVLGRKVSFLYGDPEEPRRIGASLDESICRKLSGYSTLILTKSGQTIPISLSAYWLNDQHQRSGSVGIFEDLRKLNDYKQRLELTLHAIRTVAEAENLQTGLQRLAELLVARFPGAFCGVLLFDERGTCLIEQSSAYGRGQSQPSAGPKQISVNDFPGLAELLQAGRPARLRSNRDPLIRANLNKLNEEYGFNLPIQSLLLLPIKLGARALGALALAEICPQEQSLFSREHPENVELAAAIATQLAIFVDRMRAAEQGRSQLLSFYEVSSKLITQKDPEMLLREIVSETLRVAGAVSVDLVLIDEYHRSNTMITVPADHPNRKLQVRKDGVSMQVFRSGVAAQFPKTDEARDLLNPELLSFAGAAVCLPLSLPYKRIGVMWLHYAWPRPFPEQEIAALQLYVNQAAMAYENAQEKDRIERLQRAADTLACETELDEVRWQILRMAEKTLQADAVVFGFFDQEHGEFIQELSAGRGLAPETWGEYISLDRGKEATAYRLLERRAVFIRDVNDPIENQILGEATRGLMAKEGVRSCQAVVLEIGQEKLGLICALYRQPFSFGEEERLTAASFAGHAASALKRAKLVDQVKKTNEAATVVAKITVLGHRQATLDAVIKEVRRVTGCDAVALFEFDQHKQKLLKPSVIGLNYPERTLGLDEEKDYPLVYELLNAKEPYRVVQVANHPDYQNRRFAIDEEIATFVGLPLQTTSGRVGALFVNFRAQRHFTAEELETMRLFANQAALAIHYAQFTESNERKLRELEALERLSDRLRQAQSSQEMMDHTIALAAQELGAEYCNLILPNRNGQLHLRAQFGWDPPLEPFSLEPETGSQAGFTIQTGQPVFVDDYATETRFKVIEHLRERGVKSGLSVPMFRDRQIVGALLTFTTKQRHFTDEAARFFSLIANHAAVAMRSAERYEELQQRDKQLSAVFRASQAILAKFNDEQGVLDEIVKEAVKSVTRADEPKAAMGTLQLYDAEQNELEILSVHPPESRSLLLAGDDSGRWSIDGANTRNDRIGVTGRTIQEGRSQLIGDVLQDPDYREYNVRSRSELSVPLWADYKVTGAINVESDQINDFDDDDRIALEALAGHAALAIQIAKTHKELRQIKGLVGARTALAWMGMANNAWRHTIAGDAAEVANRVTLLREYLKQGEITDERIHRHLGQIERLTKNIQERPVTPPLSSEEGVAPINLNELVVERLRQLRQNDRYEGLELAPNVEPGTPLIVSASPEWLRRALDILIDNSARAVRSLIPPDPARRVVVVSTTLKGKMVELRVTDRGPGIPAEVLDKIFKGDIESAEGQGMGLLLAEAIIETYGGKIMVDRTGSDGVEMLIRLPHHL
jgi:PAS domain S-box-containing protein